MKKLILGLGIIVSATVPTFVAVSCSKSEKDSVNNTYINSQGQLISYPEFSFRGFQYEKDTTPRPSGNYGIAISLRIKDFFRPTRVGLWVKGFEYNHQKDLASVIGYLRTTTWTYVHYGNNPLNFHLRNDVLEKKFTSKYFKKISIQIPNGVTESTKVNMLYN